MSSRGRRRGPPAAQTPPAAVRCYHCDQEGHIARVCPQRQPQLCFNCGKPGHLKRECPELAATNRHDHAPYRNERTPAAVASRGRENPALLVEVTGYETYSSATNSDSSSKSATTQSRNVYPPPATHPHVAAYMPHPLPPAAEQEQTTAKDLKLSKFIDTHCHLEYVFERFRHQGTFAEFTSKHHYPENFEGCITTFCDPMAFSPSFGIWQSLLREPNVWATFGTHPHNARYYHSSSLEEKMLAGLSHPKCVALGEIGLDYAPHTPSPAEVQKVVLTRQLELAVQLDKPVILHCRDAEEDLFDILSSTVPRQWRIHLHCFTGSLEMARKFLRTFQNLFIGVCGNVTYDSTRVRTLAAGLPLDRLLLETDAPYMVPRNLPQHLRSNKFSHPSFAFYTAREIAKVRHTNVADVLKSMRENTRLMYGI